MIYKIRAAVADDHPFLWQMLYYAAHMNESGESPESARLNSDLRPYVEGFVRPGDLGVIAIDPATNAEAGAAWLRTMPPPWPLYRFRRCRDARTGHRGRASTYRTRRRQPDD